MSVCWYDLMKIWCALVFFFFQAEDGIRDYKVTGVQTCALPILNSVPVTAWFHLNIGMFYNFEINRWEVP